MRKRRFSSYGPVDSSIEYCAPRTELIQKAVNQLVGENPEDGGHYFTVWAPRQTGKSWSLNQTMRELQKDERFYVAKIELQLGFKDALPAIKYIVEQINMYLKLDLKIPNSLEDFQEIFKKENFKKPIILILDEFDDLTKNAIDDIVSVFRNIFNLRKKDSGNAFYSEYQLHGVALIGVRSVIGIENPKGTPFNVQRSLHIPNLTFEEVKLMFDDYQQDWQQKIDAEVIEKLYYETNGQPGLVSWFGELMCEKHNETPNEAITMKQWKLTYAYATHVEPNNTIMNLVSKANQEDAKDLVFELFKTEEKTIFRFEDLRTNFLYMNGVITFENGIDNDKNDVFFTKFSSPFVQKRLFDRFARELYSQLGLVMKPFEDIDHIITDTDIYVPNLLRRFQLYFNENKHWLLKHAPKRNTDGRIYEATYHFILFSWLQQYLSGMASVTSEFPTGNGKIDLLLHMNKKIYGIEVKSYSNQRKFEESIKQAAYYAVQLKVSEITLAVFVEYIDETNRTKYEHEYINLETQIKVNPIFIAISELK